jgi:hypothetical protein
MILIRYIFGPQKNNEFFWGEGYISKVTLEWRKFFPINNGILHFGPQKETKTMKGYHASI